MYELEIFSDASCTGWGIFCKGSRSHGYWDEKDSNLHINSLELKAAFFSLKYLARERRNCNILLRMAIAYINRMRDNRYKSLSSLTKAIWH